MRYNVTFATSGQEGLDRARMTQPDLILLDLMMPNMNGWEVCEQLKAEPYLAEIPVIFLTASHEKQHLIHAFEQGAVDYITKPFNIYELLARVKTHLQIKHLTDLLKKALEKAEKLAMTDSLTEIYNRRYWLTIAQQEFNRTCRYDRSFSVVIFDIDNFKKLNDTYGHLIGDEVLKALTKAIQPSLRRADCFARFGGEEFIILLPETNLDNAREVAERMCQAVNSTKITDQEIQITVSIGVAAYQSNDTRIDDLLQRADCALYEAKRQGKNCVSTWT